MKKKTGSKFIITLLALAMALVLLPEIAFAAGGELEGDGTSSSPYKIYDYADLKAFAQIVNGDGSTEANPSACAVLEEDIVANNNPGDATYARDWTPIGKDEDHKYTDTFDGQGHTITGLSTPDDYGNYAGLFGDVESGGTMKNVGLKDGNISGKLYVGGIAGKIESNDVTIENCYNTGTVSGDSSVGGVVGYISGARSTLKNCYNTGKISGGDNSYNIGGVAGMTDGVILKNCYNSGTVSGGANGKRIGGVTGNRIRGEMQTCYNTGAVSGGTDSCEIGGVVGTNTGVTTSCYNTGKISGGDNSYNIGGVMGYHKGSCMNCYNTGTVSGGQDDGGVVDNNYNTGAVSGGVVDNNYNTGAVSGGTNSIGGVVGMNNDGSVSNAYYDKNRATGITAIGGASDTDTVKGLTTEKMTGSDALSDSNMVFQYDTQAGESSPWMPKANTEKISYYPHLMGFDWKDSQSGKRVEFPKMTENCVQMVAGEIDQKYWPAKAHIHRVNNQVIYFQPWTRSDGLPTAAGNYYLTEDVTLSNTWTVLEGETSLCLNGHGIKFNGTKICVINIENNNGTLNLYDCDTSTKHSFTVSDGLATIDDTFNENNQTFTGGYITGGNNSSNGGGVRASGTFNMYGGTIIGNNGYHGGGVDVASGATFNMNGGSIMYNTASHSGGGVNTVETFNMDEGSIENNTAGVDGGGVNIGMTGKLNMTGGSITENTANGSEGGGVWVSSGGLFTVSGNANISGNKTGDEKRNVYLKGDTAKITVNGSLKGEDNSKANIGVTMESSGVFTSGWSTKMESTSNPADYFFSDNSDYGVTLTTGEKPEAQLLRCYPLKYDSNGGSGNMDPQSVYDGATFTFPECTFTPPSNKAFDHWEMSGVDSQNQPVNGVFYPNSTVKIASNCAPEGVITVTAHWKDMATVTKAPEAKNPTYNGSAQELVTEGTAEHGTMNYAIGNSTAPTTDWSVNIPTGTDAGTYYVWYKAVGDATYADSDPKCVTATIKSRHNTPTAAERVANEIKALSDPVTLANREKVDKAKAAYDALPEAQKKQVPADLVQKLNKAVDTIAVLLVSDQIAGLPEPVTLDDAAAVDATVEAYLALTDSQKAIFSETDLQKLIEAETAIGTLRAAGITVKIGKVKNLKGGKVRMQLGNPHYNAAKGKAASGKPALSAQEVTGINGFCIQYSTDKKFKKKVKTKKIKNPKAKTVTIKHLKKGKTYYFRTCTYTEVKNRVSGEEKTVKGKWSTKKKVKINK